MTRELSSLRIAIVNPLTLVGREVTSILHERGLPYAKIELYDSTGEDEGALTEVASEPAVVSPLRDGLLEGTDIVFFCGPSEKNERWIDTAEQYGFVAIDLSNPPAFDGEGAVAVAGVNIVEMSPGSVIVSPHPIAAPLIHALSTIAGFGIELAAVTAIQPASEFDQKGIDELLGQTIAALNLKSIPTTIFDRQLAFNLYPATAVSAVERLVVAQTRSILGRDLQLAVSITQGSTFHGHTFSLFVRLSRKVGIEEMKRAISASSALQITESDDFVSTIDAAGKDQILVGQVEPDATIENGWWIWLAADNLRRGSALNGVLIAEEFLVSSLPSN
jgi:aspartate-semialdehyde dehydrogenase